MESLIEKTQEVLNKSIETIPKSIVYTTIVLDKVKPLVDKLIETKEFPFIRRNPNVVIDVYVEACAQVLINEYVKNINNYEYSLYKDTVLPLVNVIEVLEEHPFLINLIHRNITYKEWDEYRHKILEEIKHTRDEHLNKSELELLCGVDTERNKSVIHNFNYMMGLSFEETGVSITYNDLMEKIGDKNGLLILHISKGVLKDSIVIYKQIEKINKELILNPEKVKKLRPIYMPETIYEYKDDYEVINPKAEGFNVALCYDDGKTLKDCTYSVSKFGYPMTFLQRYLDGACPRTLSSRDIDIYLQEWLFERFSDEHETEEAFAQFLFTLQHIAQDNYDENVDRCINKILKDDRLKKILPTEKERGIFYTYVHGLKMLSSTRMSDVVDYIKSYVGDVF